jgi:hypothetical protein
MAANSGAARAALSSSGYLPCDSEWVSGLGLQASGFGLRASGFGTEGVAQTRKATEQRAMPGHELGVVLRAPRAKPGRRPQTGSWLMVYPTEARSLQPEA